MNVKDSNSRVKKKDPTEVWEGMRSSSGNRTDEYIK